MSTTMDREQIVQRVTEGLATLEKAASYHFVGGNKQEAAHIENVITKGEELLSMLTAEDDFGTDKALASSVYLLALNLCLIRQEAFLSRTSKPLSS